MAIPRAYYRILRQVLNEKHHRLPDGPSLSWYWEMSERGLVQISGETAQVSITEAGRLAVLEYEHAHVDRKKVQVIVTEWGPRTRTTAGLRFVETMEQAEEACLYAAEPFRKPGICVIVRPCYNDDNETLSYHEFRSFDGGRFERVDFKGK